MEKKSTQRRSFFKKLTDRYRLIIYDEDTFEHKLDFSLSRLNVFVVIGIVSLFLISLTTLIIAVTPLREYIPGYPSADFKTKIYRLNLKMDSLKVELEKRNLFLENIKKIMSGEITPELTGEFEHNSVSEKPVKIDTTALKPSQADLQLRKEVEEKEKYQIGIGHEEPETSGFISPLRGMISQGFDLTQKHYGTDIIVKTQTPVKSIAKGHVIFSDWTPDNGNVIIIQHQGGWTSVYKHNLKNLKQQGDLVKAGEVVAISGNVGTNSTGPHLHFELWKKGQPVDPENYIDFSE